MRDPEKETTVARPLADHWMSVRAAAELIGITRQSVHRLGAAGDLETDAVDGVILVGRESAERYKARRDARRETLSTCGAA